MKNSFSEYATAITDLCIPPPISFSILIFLLCYIIGSIPFGVILTKLAGYGDIRKIGSGNIGATNVLRTGNKLLAFSTLILDGSKAAFVVLLIKPSGTILSQCYSNNDLIELALYLTFFTMIGHCFPIWLNFKGGKGVATALGGLLAANPAIGLTACLAWLLTAIITKISSLSALVAFGVAPLATLLVYRTPSVIIGNTVFGGTYAFYEAALCSFISLLIFWRHKDNIKRLIKGDEPKIGSQKEKGE